MDNDLLSINLYALRRQLLLYRGLVIVLGLLFVGAVATRLGAAPTHIEATVVSAHEFNLVNATGRVTARLTSDPSNPDSPNLVLKYPNDKPAILLGIDNKTGSSVSLLNSNGLPRAIMSEDANGPSLTLFDEADKIRIVLDAGRAGPQISIYDKNRKRTVVAFSN